MPAKPEGLWKVLIHLAHLQKWNSIIRRAFEETNRTLEA
jgi:hypothetical protein